MGTVLRFGEMALQMRLVSIDQLEEGLRIQKSGRGSGLNRSIGACLHDLGHLDLVQAEAVMRALGYPVDRCRLIPDIELKLLLGRGASGAVYRGYSTPLSEDVAVKVRAPKVHSDDPGGRRFKLEAGFGQRLNHPNIVRLFDAGETRDFTYHVLEFVDGTALDEVMRNAHGPLAPKLIAEIGEQMAAALTCAELEGIVHRDIKPANIIIANSGRVKLCDLGLAKDINSTAQLTATGMLLGSPYYISPEYARTGDLDARSDIYGLGVTLYHAACGEVPFPGKTAIEILDAVVRAPTPDPAKANPSLPPGLRNIIRRMIDRNPNARQQSPTELGESFAAYKRGDPIPDPNPKGFLSKVKSFFSGG